MPMEYGQYLYVAMSRVERIKLILEDGEMQQ